MNRRFLIVLTSLVATQPCHASFELLMALDASDKVVHRYDAETGVYLGNFGNGYIQNPISMDIDQATNTAYILQDSSSTSTVVTKLNYNTGAFLGELMIVPFQPSIARGITVLNSGGIGVSVFGSDLDFYDANGVAQSFLAGSGAVHYGLTQVSSGAVLAINGDSVLNGWTGTTATSPSFSLGAAGPVALRGQVTSYGQTVVASLGTQGYYYARVSPSNFGFSLTTGGTTSRISSVAGVGIGHNDAIYLAGLDSGSPTRGVIERRFGPTGSFFGTFGQNELTAPVALSVVVAPEPGTIGVLCFALVGLLRRRKS